MKNPFLKFIEDDINAPNKPFYKRKLFFIGIGLLLLIIIIIIIIVVSVSQKSFSSNSFIESKGKIINPDQGFYRTAGVKIEPESFVVSSNRPEQLYHLRCDISQFSGAVNSEQKDLLLTDKALNSLDEYLYKIKSENKNAIIRFAYAPGFGSAADKEPSLSMIEQHIKQLSKIINKHLDTLTAIEAGMLGPWGEMHSSKIATEQNKALVFKYWLDNTKDIPVLARTPKSIFTYFNKSLDEMEKFKINKDNKGYRLGLFNDCYLSSSNDVGTYSNRNREINWLSTQNDHVPYGGEVCQVYELSNLENCLPEMHLLSLSYLNYEYNQAVIIQKWQNLKYNSSLGKDSLFYDISGYDYIHFHMGYRLVIRSIDIEYKKRGNFEMKINIENVGFGNLFKTKNVDIVYTNMNGTIIISKKCWEI